MCGLQCDFQGDGALQHMLKRFLVKAVHSCWWAGMSSVTRCMPSRCCWAAVAVRGLTKHIGTTA